MKTITLFRPVGKTELLLIADSQMKAFPPRLSWQPVFYPVLNQPYAEQIANDWNTNDAFSDYAGFVTAFEIPESFFQRFEVQIVGGEIHQEIWVPAEELNNFNQKIVNDIRVVNAFFGNNYQPDVRVTELLNHFQLI